MHLLHKYYKLLLLFAYCFIITSIAFSQQNIYESAFLTPDDGLGNLMTTAIYKDSKGFIWIGTNNGLNRYDGYKFKLYTNEKNGLIANKIIRNIIEDSQGNLWLLIETSQKNRYYLNIFNPITAQTIPLDQYFKSAPPFSANEVRNVTINANNQIWLTTISGEVYLYEALHFKKIYDANNDALNQRLATTSKQLLWASYGKKLVQINKEGQTIQDFDFSEKILNIYPENNGNVWLVTYKYTPKIGRICHIWLKEKNKPTFEPFLLEGIDPNLSPIWNIIRSKEGAWYIASKDRILKFSATGKRLVDFHDFIDDGLETSFHDYLEIGTQMWFATPIGILKTTSKVNPFQLIHQKKSLSDCRGITEDEVGNIYFINKVELFKWQPISNTTTKVLNHGANYLQYHQGTLIGGSYGVYVLGFQFNLSSKKHKFIPDSIANVSYSLQQTSKENLFYIGHNFGISKWDKDQEELLPFKASKEFSIFNQSKVYDIFKDKTDYWLATQNGIFLLDEKQGIKAHFCKANGQLPFDYIQHIHKDEAGIFWLATKGNGIIRWEIERSNYQEFTTADGLSNNYIYAIYEDDYNHLWLPSDMGLMRMNKSTFELQTFTTKDGLPHNEFNFSAHYQAKDGHLYFGGLGGLITFHPKKFVTAASFKAPLAFTKLKILEEGADKLTDKTALLHQASDLIVQPTDKLIELEFSLLDYESTENLSYAYNIEGYTNKWTYIKENTIRITHLPYGNYVLRIKGQNSRKGWSAQELTLNIKVRKPFYLQWWFITPLLISMIGIMVGIIKIRERVYVKNQKLLEEKVQQRTATIQQQTEKLKNLDDLKSRFFANITHELKTPLTLISAPLQEVLDKAPLSKKVSATLSNIQQNTRNLINLVEELLDLSKMEHSRLTLDEEKVIFYSFIRRLVAVHHSYAQYRAIDLVFNYELNQQLQILADPKKIEKIINNLLSNALKFTASGGQVQIKVSDLGGQLKIAVSDTGMGIHPDDLPYIFERFFQSKKPRTAAEGGTGIGLALSKEYATLMEGTLEVESKWGEGSTFSFLFPKKEVFSEIVDVSSPTVTPSSNTKPTAANIPPQLQQKILVVEDNLEMANYIKSILEKQYKIIQADNGQTALKRLEKHPIDLIISDVMMPQMDGFQLLEAVKQQAALFFKPFIIVTARIETADRLKALQLGVDDYLTKPFVSEELLARVNNLISNYNAREAYLKETSKRSSFIPPTTTTSSVATIWLKELEGIVKGNIKDTRFNVTRLATLLHISESSLRNKVKAHTGLSPVEYLREARLAQARHLLESRRYTTVAEVVYAIGMKHPANFTKMYKKRFGKLPSEYL